MPAPAMMPKLGHAAIFRRHESQKAKRAVDAAAIDSGMAITCAVRIAMALA